MGQSTVLIGCRSVHRKLTVTPCRCRKEAMQSRQMFHLPAWDSAEKQLWSGVLRRIMSMPHWFTLGPPHCSCQGLEFRRWVCVHNRCRCVTPSVVTLHSHVSYQFQRQGVSSLHTLTLHFATSEGRPSPVERCPPPSIGRDGLTRGQAFVRICL